MVSASELLITAKEEEECGYHIVGSVYMLLCDVAMDDLCPAVL